ncbi:MAG: methyltransferase domain-containing protein [Acidimicrobiales bacterium]|nr:methyltransferase domain-containing protein [Acidimicrobiales bacterium]
MARTPRNARHDEDPEGYDQLRRGWLNRRRAEFFAERVRLARPEVVVEVGCGTGRLLTQLAEASPGTRFLGVEPLADYVEFGRRLIADAGLTNVELHVATGEEVAAVVPPAIADLVLSSDVLHHVTSQADVAGSVRRIAKPGARWVVVEPSAANVYVGAFQALANGERNFRIRPFLRAAESSWALTARSRMFLIPAAIETPPAWLVGMERRLERVPGLGGAVVLELTAR